jgi:hypothetical protein
MSSTKELGSNKNRKISQEDELCTDKREHTKKMTEMSFYLSALSISGIIIQQPLLPFFLVK